MQYVIREVREGDLPYLAANLRSADTKELIATYGNTQFLEGLQRSVALSDETRLCEGDGFPMVLWGIIQFSPKVAAIWCCATPNVVKFRRPFVQESRAVLQRWFDERPTLQSMINFSHAENVLHHKWLRSCGATVFPSVPNGPLGEPFSPFVIRRPPLCATSV